MKLNTLLTSIFLLSINGISHAALATANFQTNAQITATCQIQSSALNFGQIDPNIMDQRAQADINVRCSKSLMYKIEFTNGNGTVGDRRMVGESGNTDVLKYTVYTAGDFEFPVDDGSGGGGSFNSRAIEGEGTGDNFVHTVYGQVGNSQFVKPGNYGDTITMLITY